MLLSLLILAEAAATSTPMPAFLSGCWEQRQEVRWTEECWTDTRGGLMIGSGRTGKGDKVGHWEWMRIERDVDGVLTFYGSPKGAPAVGFRASEVSENSITFVNSSHDYPQRVRYVATSTGLDAEVSLADGSEPTRWSYRRKAGSLNEQ